MITRPPIRYITPDTDSSHYHLFLSFEVENKSQGYAPTHDISTINNKSRVRISIFNEQPLRVVLRTKASRFQVLGMNLNLSSDSVLKLFLIFYHIGEHFNTATCPFLGINLFLLASTSSKYSCNNPSPSENSMVKIIITLYKMF